MPARIRRANGGSRTLRDLGTRHLYRHTTSNAYQNNTSNACQQAIKALEANPLEALLAKSGNELSPDSRELATIAQRNGLHLLRLVNALLDFSRIEAERTGAAYVPTDLSKLTAERVSSFQSACDRAELRPDVVCPSLREPVYLDRDMWEMVILSLFSDACKFTLKGGILVCVTERPNGAEFTAADTGVGIDRSRLPCLFEHFHLIEAQRSRSHEGNGIGLTLVQELVHLLGGRISVDSRPNRASAFLEEAPGWLPRKTVAANPEPSEHAATHDAGAAMQSARILVADDNADMRDYLIRLLSAQGWTIDAVADGSAALAAAYQNRPDLVLADVMTPGLDGLVAAMRANFELASVPIMLLSAQVGEEQEVAGLASGADDYLVKPFTAHKLVARMQTHLARSRQRQEAAEYIRQSEARLKAAIDLVGLCLYAWDPATGALEWNDRLRAIWGTRSGRLCRRGHFPIRHPPRGSIHGQGGDRTLRRSGKRRHVCLGISRHRHW